MMRNGRRKPLFERLKQGLEEGIRFARGETKLRTTLHPQEPPHVTPNQVVYLRERLGMSRRVFAQTLNVSENTLRSWELGARQPSHAALRLLQVLNHRADAVLSVVGVSTETNARTVKA